MLAPNCKTLPASFVYTGFIIVLAGKTGRAIELNQALLPILKFRGWLKWQEWWKKG
jgi:hypothetical protein